MYKKYVLKLKPEERSELLQLIPNGTAAAKTLTHARVWLKADATNVQPAWTDQAISDALEVSVATIERVRHRYVQQGLVNTLKRKSQARHRGRQLDGNQEAHLIALVCSEPPTGHGRWTLRLLAERTEERVVHSPENAGCLRRSNGKHAGRLSATLRFSLSRGMHG